MINEISEIFYSSPKVTNELKDVLKQITQELNNEKNEIEEHDI